MNTFIYVFKMRKYIYITYVYIYKYTERDFSHF